MSSLERHSRDAHYYKVTCNIDAHLFFLSCSRVTSVFVSSDSFGSLPELSGIRESFSVSSALQAAIRNINQNVSGDRGEKSEVSSLCESFGRVQRSGGHGSFCPGSGQEKIGVQERSVLPGRQANVTLLVRVPGGGFLV